MKSFSREELRLEVCKRDVVDREPWKLQTENNQIKQRRAWLLLGQVTAERSCPCKRPACPAIGGGSEVTFKPL
ncbi:hypothetical protein J6590_098120, partial [Homalodisca vitripennis]